MRDYAKVVPKFWTGQTCKELRARGSEGPLVALYLMSSPMSNMLGLFCQPMLYMAHETGLGLEGARKGLRECVESGFCKYDEASETVFVIEMASYQIATELKASDNRCAGIQKEYESLPDNPFLSDFFDRYQHAFHLKNRRACKGASKALPSQEQEQEQEQEEERADIRPSSFADGPAKPESDQKLNLTPPADLGERKARRLRQITVDAITAFNAKLGKPNGLLASVSLSVGLEKRQAQVQRMLRVAGQICAQEFDSPRVTPEFWQAYFEEIDRDPFKSGRQEGGRGHENWKPTFEYLTREKTALEVFDASQDSAA